MTDPHAPQWEDCKVCGSSDHWTKDHPKADAIPRPPTLAEPTIANWWSETNDHDTAHDAEDDPE